MFDFLKKLTPKADNQWTIAEGKDGEWPLIWRIRQAKPKNAGKEHRFLLMISWKYEPELQQRMPGKVTTDGMSALEDALDKALEQSGQSFLMVVVTGNGVREWQWYSRDVEESLSLINKALVNQPIYPIKISSELDEGWIAYSQIRSQIK